MAGPGMVELLPKEYGFVVAVLVLYCFLNFYMAVKVGRARRRYNVPYPILYASESENKDAKLFNCVQRGHQNSLELMPIFFMLMILGGLKHPSLCAALGVLYIVGRYFYFTGYSTGDPTKRRKGIFGMLGLLGLMLCTISFGCTLLHKPASP
ncbi:hypothetical protein L6164_030878 [Bauhinia variegata]|uniref:Uncharacterized protein n=1 Tax=Bauhinia variegata TaxID=167791 RepID=A0ACB9LDC4_BAUVA|nr:hypothetical protein L6164_030878 [Bauhinia variegata]